MCPVLMYINTLDVLAVDVTTQVRSFVNHQAFLAHQLGTIGKGGSEQAGADNQIIVFHHYFILIRKIILVYGIHI